MPQKQAAKKAPAKKAAPVKKAAAKKALSDDTLAQDTSLDAKYTTAALAAKLATHATYGPPNGKARKPTDEQKRDHPEIVTLDPHPWTVLTAP